MNLQNLKLPLIAVFALAVLLLYGCSSSSNSLRYKHESQKKSEENSTVRFTSEDKKNNYEKEIADNSSYTAEENFNDTDDDSEEFPDEESGVDISSVITRINSSESSADLSADNSTNKEKILMEIIKYLNTPYKYGGNSKDGIDCSAFTQTIYRNCLSIPLLRTARDQFTMGIKIEDREDLQFGDLVFFNTRRRVRPGHVGIYIGDNLFAHASSKHGVIISSLDHEYYSKRYMGARRIEGKLNAQL